MVYYLLDLLLLHCLLQLITQSLLARVVLGTVFDTFDYHLFDLFSPRPREKDYRDIHSTLNAFV